MGGKCSNTWIKKKMKTTVFNTAELVVLGRITHAVFKVSYTNLLEQRGGPGFRPRLHPCSTRNYSCPLRCRSSMYKHN
jgi:hypothetical protein